MMRRLEIGPGTAPLDGFEALDIIKRPGVKHVGDAANVLSVFNPNTFDMVYASHIIEHIDWFKLEQTLADWVKILKPGGTLEIHTVDAAPLMRTMLAYEEGEDDLPCGKWKSEFHKGNPFMHAQGRIFCYAKKGDGGAHAHRSMFTKRFLRELMEGAGLKDVVDAGEPRGRLKHKAVNMGLTGVKA